MNILIVGNGFDLSHYLPTKYDHFMDAMEAIENKELGKPLNDLVTSHFENVGDLIVKFLQLKKAINPQTYEMNFDELFSQCRDRNFITKTKQIYVTDNIKLSFEKIVEIQFLLKNNSWYQYFKNHVKEIKTWIDFEQKIYEALRAISIFIDKINEKIDEIGYCSDHINHSGECEKSQIFIKAEYCKILEILNLLKSGYYGDGENEDEYGRKFTKPYETGNDFDDYRFYIKDEINSYKNGYQKIDEHIILENLQKSLDNFIEIFNLYLTLVVDNSDPKVDFMINASDWINPDQIYSFNYTNTFQRLYSNVVVDYLHGFCGKNQNIVLGISDLEDESLKKLKAYGFTKYHQKLFKDTNYLFLDKFKKDVEVHKKKIEYLEKDSFGNSKEKMLRRMELMENESKLNLNICIWGHSLDYSDKDYILDLFSLNDDIDRNVRVVVYYFDKPAKFSLLNNLLVILGKDKVEYWMKNKWLKFDPNPEVNFQTENKIELEQVS
ncbi:hypothetical protein F894_02763 [Acinetobacter sp. CIP 51.11]|uniref:AbiH family protein n=1 Tax=Acinetobacter sp. CIP 51.11 TaxID=1144670 RepID=UPI0002D02069|nr:AbiH family protein [Acinetobacter sp. CIP 51.11]ENX12843.1 hypothetical protein F894_02763 [Acinetobacter sp. CIP 51.11]